MKIDQLPCKVPHLVEIAASSPNMKPDIKAVVPAECRERLLQCVDPRSKFEIAVREWVQNADSTYSLRLLRARTERPSGCHTASVLDEVAPTYCLAEH